MLPISPHISMKLVLKADAYFDVIAFILQLSIPAIYMLSLLSVHLVEVLNKIAYKRTLLN